MRLACCIMSYSITKGMKSVGPIGTLKRNKKSKELICQQIEYLKKIFRNVDIYVISGFGKDKIQQALQDQKKRNVYNIYNPKYADTNHSYAIKLFLNSIRERIDEYSGVFFLDSNTMIREIPIKKKNQSWVVVIDKINKNQKNYIGINLNRDTGQVRYLFYNINNAAWCQSFYLTQKHIKAIISKTEDWHDNMFLFELINKFIDEYNLDIYANYLDKTKDYINISGPKDKNQIK